jgi:hypothetical protein
MAGFALAGDTSGQLVVNAPAVAGSNTITLPAATGTAALTSDVIGVSQTWQNVTSSRALGTIYTNSTGKPIMIAVSATGNGGFIQAILIGQINSVTIITNGANSGTAGGATYASFTLIVPNGATYNASNGGGCTLQTWFELR